MTVAAATSPHRRSPLFALLAANAISLTGNVFALIAIPWFVLETTGSAARTGLAGFAAALPVVIAALFGGALIDRIGFRRMSVVSDLASGVTVALIPLLHATVGLAFWQLLVLVFLGGLLDTPGTTARMALLPDLAGLAGMRLERANAIEQMVQRGSQLLGAPLAGIVIAATDVSAALWIDGASFAVSAAVVGLLVPSLQRSAPEASPAPAAASGPLQRYLHDLRDGLRFIRADALMLPLVAMVAVTNFLDAMIGLMAPVYAERVFGSAFALGLLYAAVGGGAVATTILFGIAGHRLPRRDTFIWCFVLSGMGLWVLVATPGLALCVAAMVVRGFGAGPLNPILMTVGQERIPAEMRGRVLGVIGSIAWVAIPAGRLLSGVLVEWTGVIAALAIVTTLYIGVTLSMLLIRALRAMDAPIVATRTRAPGWPVTVVAGRRD
jgi:MFS family permease